MAPQAAIAKEIKFRGCSLYSCLGEQPLGSPAATQDLALRSATKNRIGNATDEVFYRHTDRGSPGAPHNVH